MKNTEAKNQKKTEIDQQNRVIEENIRTQLNHILMMEEEDMIAYATD